MKHCALVIGHGGITRDPGAINEHTGTTELVFNSALALDILPLVQGVKISLIHRDTYEGLPAKVNQTRADFAIELHCNAFAEPPGYIGEATGCQMVHFAGSENGQRLAATLQQHVQPALANKNRGVIAVGAGRGAWFLQKTAMPAVICEPFFIDADQDLGNALLKRADLVQAYAQAIEAFASR